MVAIIGIVTHRSCSSEEWLSAQHQRHAAPGHQTIAGSDTVQEVRQDTNREAASTEDRCAAGCSQQQASRPRSRPETRPVLAAASSRSET